MSRRTTAAWLLALTSLGLAGCTDGSSGGTTSAAEAANCPGQVLDVVVSVNPWGDIVDTLGADCATVTTILGSAAGDPHDHQPSTGDIASFEGADLVVVNGAGYDGWATDAVANLDPAPAVVDAARVVGVAGEPGANPHLWYSPDAVRQTAQAVTAALIALDPAAADYVAEQSAAWMASLQPYDDELSALTGLAAGKTYAATETVFDETAGAVGLTDVTPQRYRNAVSNDGEPAPGDIAAFEQALSGGDVDVLIHNTQTAGSVPEQLRAVAEGAGVPVVEVTESMPADADSYVDWQLSQLQELAAALGGDR